MKIGLYFGSFNPVHNGHMIIANYMVEFTDLEQIWFVVSPQNPLKKKSGLLADYHRLELLNLAIDNYSGFHASDIEFKMPKPSYTIDTLTYLSEKYPNHEFSLIIGADNLISLNKWKNHEQIIANYNIYVIPRKSYDTSKVDYINLDRIQITTAPIMEISSSFIREAIKNGHDVRYFVPKEVYDYIKCMNFYIGK
jgi:nicotinate-nucleotide adenylyltransferase